MKITQEVYEKIKASFLKIQNDMKLLHKSVVQVGEAVNEHDKVLVGMDKRLKFIESLVEEKNSGEESNGFYEGMAEQGEEEDQEPDEPVDLSQGNLDEVSEFEESKRRVPKKRVVPKQRGPVRKR